MSIIKKNEVLAVFDNEGKVACLNCKKIYNNYDDLKDEIITAENVSDDEILVCDTCKRTIYEKK